MSMSECADTQTIVAPMRRNRWFADTRIVGIC